MSSQSTPIFRFKTLFFNLMLGAIVLGFNPDWLGLVPKGPDIDYYLGVLILLGLFLEYAGIWFKSRNNFSFETSLHKPAPLHIGLTFVPRVLITGAIATLALGSMGALEVSDFFLLPLVLFATFKEFGVRQIYLNSERELLPRPNRFRRFIGDILLFLALVIAYLAIWKIYLLEHPHIMFVMLSPINWGFAGLAFLGFLYCMEMPLFHEEILRNKPKSQRVLSYMSLLLPVLALLGRFFLFSYLA